MGSDNWLLLILCLSKHLPVWVDMLCLHEQGFQKLIHNTELANTLSSGLEEGQAKVGCVPSETRYSILRLFSPIMEDEGHCPPS